MKVKNVRTQISIFFKYSGQEPISYEEIVEEKFGDIMKKSHSFGLPDAPDEMPTLVYSSHDQSIVLEMSKKRYNFIIQNPNGIDFISVESVLKKIKDFVETNIFPFPNPISRMGMAVTNAIFDTDKNAVKFVEQFAKTTFSDYRTNEVYFRVNKEYKTKNIKYNFNITLSGNTIDESKKKKNLPNIVIDYNNVPVDKMSLEQIYEVLDNYEMCSPKKAKELLNID